MRKHQNIRFNEDKQISYMEDVFHGICETEI